MIPVPFRVGVALAAHRLGLAGSSFGVVHVDPLGHGADPLGHVGIAPVGRADHGCAGAAEDLDGAVLEAFHEQVRGARPGLLGKEQAPPGPDAHGVGLQQAEEHDGTEQRGRRPNALAERPRVEDLRQADFAERPGGIAARAGKEFRAEALDRFIALRQFDRREQAVAELREVALQQQGHARVAQWDKRAADDPAEEDPSQPESDQNRQDLPHGRSRLKVAVDRQTGPKGRSQPGDGPSQPLQPDVPADPPPQGVEHLPDRRGQFGLEAVARHSTPISTTAG